MDEQLTDRKKRILKAIIRTYMETGEPVGSRTISKDKDLNVSSAMAASKQMDSIHHIVSLVEGCVSK